MKKVIFPAIFAALLTGCAADGWMTSQSEPNQSNLGVDENGRLKDSQPAEEVADTEMLGDFKRPPGNTTAQDSNFQSRGGTDYYVGNDGSIPTWSQTYSTPMIKNINDFVRGIMHSLVDNVHYVNDKTPIGVASFVFLDGPYNKTNLLGNQIAESFMHEVHQFGIPVIDFKTTDYIRVTASGDFIFSRDFLELKDELPVKYVLAGTLVKHQAGYLVNARIVGLTSKAIVASAQGFIPNAVADALMPSESNSNDGILLLQGE